MPSLTLRNPLRRDPSRPSLRDRAAALRATAARLIRRQPDPIPAAPAPAVEQAPDPVLAAIAASHAAEVAADAIAAEIEREGMTPERFKRDSDLGGAAVSTRNTVWSTPPTTQAGRRALIQYARFQVGLHTHPDGTIDAAEFLIPEILGAVSGLVDALDAPAAVSAPDPHVALLPALRQAFAWTREAYPFGDDPSNSPEGRAHTAVLHHSWDLANRITELPPPTTLAGLGALALAMSVYAEEIIGRPQNDGLDHERYPEERRIAAAVRAMMSVAGVSPFPGWVGFEVGPDSEARWRAVAEQAGEGFLPAWAIAGKTGPDDERSA